MATNPSNPFIVDCQNKLLLAALKGNWEDAKEFFEVNIEWITQVICKGTGMNALHAAAANGQTKFVEKTVDFIIDKTRERGLQSMGDDNCISLDKLTTSGGFSALHLAAMGGHLKMAKALVKGKRELTQLREYEEDTPLLCAVKSYSKYKLVRYLALVTDDEDPGLPLTVSKAGDLMFYLTHMGFHDISLYLIGRQLQNAQHAQLKKSLALAKSERNETILKLLASEPANFYSGTKLNFWQRWIYSLISVHDKDLELETSPSDDYDAEAPGVSTIRGKKLRHRRACKLVEHCLEALRDCCNENKRIDYFNEQQILRLAARHGIVEIVTASLQYFPDLIFLNCGALLLKDAITWRQEKIFNLACKSTVIDKFLATVFVDKQGDAPMETQQDSSKSACDVERCTSPSHLAAKLPTISRSSNDFTAGASQMQREMQWYKAVERIQHPSLRELPVNKKGETAFDIFSENHKTMRGNAEKWMKDTSNSSMVVSALIATVAFAAAFQLPGGTDDESGYPIFLNQISFKVFVCADALALFSSVTSILMFLSILTSRYKEEDFLRALPKRMILGLFFLFLALAAIMVSFGAGLALVLNHRYKWVLATVPVFIPVSLFIMLQLPLFVEMCESTYATRFHPENIW